MPPLGTIRLTFAQTVSWVASKPEDERERIARDLDALVDEGPFAHRAQLNVTWATRT